MFLIVAAVSAYPHPSKVHYILTAVSQLSAPLVFTPMPSGERRVLSTQCKASAATYC